MPTSAAWSDNGSASTSVSKAGTGGSDVARIRWLACGEGELPTDPAWLTTREQERVAMTRFTKRRTEFLLRRWTGKQAVAAALDRPATVTELARIEVTNRRSGAPYVLLDGTPVAFDISLTDRAGWAVCVVGADLSRVGCDLEIVEPRSAGFITDFLTQPEQKYVAAHADPHAAANLLWSAKESALKVLRTGLRRDTRSVEVSLGEPGRHGWTAMQVRGTEGSVMPGWWRREGTFLLTVASDRDIPEPEQMPVSANLASAEPVHSWVEHPLIG